jgi:hypothetical protein
MGHVKRNYLNRCRDILTKIVSMIKIFFKLFLIYLLLIYPHDSYSLNPEQEEQKPKSDQTNLNLPDVIIYGTERSIRKIGSKLNVKGESFQILTQHIDSSSPSSVKQFRFRKLIHQEKMPSTAVKSKILLQYGSYNTPNVIVNRWQEFKHTNYGINIGYNRSDGQFENSQFYKTNGSLNLGIDASQSIKFSIKSELSKSEYGLYGSPIEQFNRSLTIGKAHIFSNYKLSSSLSSSMNFSIKQTNLSDDAKIDSVNNEIQERALKLSADITKIIKTKTRLMFGVKYSHNEIIDSTETLNHLIAFSGLTFPVADFLTLNTTVSYEKITSAKERFSPTVELSFTPFRSIGLSFKGTRYYKANYFSELLNKSDYLSPKISQPITDVKFDLNGKLELLLSKSIIFKTEASRKWIDNFLYWQKDNVDGLFLINTFQDLYLTTLSNGLEINIFDRLALTTNLIYYNDNTIPYLENYRLSNELKIKLPKGFVFKLKSLWIGPRQTLLDDSYKLDDYVLLSFRGEKNINRHIFLTIGGENLLDQTYEIWEGFQEMGVRFNVGLKGEW